MHFFENSIVLFINYKFFIVLKSVKWLINKKIIKKRLKTSELFYKYQIFIKIRIHKKVV